MANTAILIPGAQKRRTPGCTITAASASQAHVQAAIDAAADGSVVCVPSGTSEWTSRVTVTGKSIVLKGAGVGATILQDGVPRSGGGQNGTMIAVTLTSGQYFRLTGFTFEPGPITSNHFNGIVAVGGSADLPSVRLDHLHFELPAARMFLLTDVLGVADHITAEADFKQMFEINHAQWGGQSNGDGSWAAPTNFGSADFFFVEDCEFTNVATASPSIVDSTRAGRFVVRYCTIHDDGITVHGTESSNRNRGCRAVEVYGNVFDTPTIVKLSRAVRLRAGTGLIHSNSFDDFTNVVQLTAFRRADSFSVWSYGDGAGPYDDNDATTYATGTHTGANGVTVLTDGGASWATNEWATFYAIRNLTQGWGSAIVSNTGTTIERTTSAFGDTYEWNTGDSYEIRRPLVLIDQPGRGQSDLITGATPTPTGWVHNAAEPVRVWNNTITNCTNTIASDPNTWAVLDTDYALAALGGYTPYTYPHPLRASGALRD